MEIKKGTLVSVKNNGEHNFRFEYFLHYDEYLKANVYVFDIWEEGRESKPKFSFLLRVMENGTDLKVIDLFAGEYYKGKGISVAIILNAKELFNKRITSSSKKVKSHYSEDRWKDAEKVWQGLVEKGFAKYDEHNDYYYTL
jgi:hypothetical protein